VPESLGVKLRVAREAKGLTIDQLSAITKIHAAFITALENGRWDLLPGRVYLKPFTKLCAEALDLDFKDLFDKIDGMSSANKEAVELQSTPVGEPAKKRVDYKLPIIFFAALAVIAIIVFAVRSRRFSRQDIPQESVVPAHGIPRRVDIKWERPWERPSINPEFDQAERLRLEAAADIWACVLADGDTAFAGTITGGEGKTFGADSTFKVTLSRNDRVTAYLNGLKVEGIGSSPKKLLNFTIGPEKKDQNTLNEIK
jgi:transcriptional regulator with XRE-family HTH domain